MTFQPIGDRVLVELSPRSKVIHSLELPTYVKETLSEGKVIAFGRGKLLDDGRCIRPDMLKGDRIAFVPPANAPIMETGHLIIRMDDIVGFIEG